MQVKTSFQMILILQGYLSLSLPGDQCKISRDRIDQTNQTAVQTAVWFVWFLISRALQGSQHSGVQRINHVLWLYKQQPNKPNTCPDRCLVYLVPYITWIAWRVQTINHVWWLYKQQPNKSNTCPDRCLVCLVPYITWIAVARSENKPRAMIMWTAAKQTKHLSGQVFYES